MDEIMEALALEDEEEAELVLKHAIRRLYLALICQTLVLFDYACFQEQDDEDQIPVFLAKICKKFFR
ncbi:hypothetical protein DL95DRAFT_467635 [Leptodontidium sp. 2 PMI_412]|nr:hypothetical protein DL95DRAFT_467635 [Leptodontidium sp. 2 PMI_412]